MHARFTRPSTTLIFSLTLLSPRPPDSPTRAPTPLSSHTPPSVPPRRLVVHGFEPGETDYGHGI